MTNQLIDPSIYWLWVVFGASHKKWQADQSIDQLINRSTWQAKQKNKLNYSMVHLPYQHHPAESICDNNLDEEEHIDKWFGFLDKQALLQETACHSKITWTYLSCNCLLPFLCDKEFQPKILMHAVPCYMVHFASIIDWIWYSKHKGPNPEKPQCLFLMPILNMNEVPLVEEPYCVCSGAILNILGFGESSGICV